MEGEIGCLISQGVKDKRQPVRLVGKSECIELAQAALEHHRLTRSLPPSTEKQSLKTATIRQSIMVKDFDSQLLYGKGGMAALTLPACSRMPG